MTKISKTELLLGKLAVKGGKPVYVGDERSVGTCGRVLMVVEAAEPRQLGTPVALDAKACAKAGAALPRTKRDMDAGFHEAELDVRDKTTLTVSKIRKGEVERSEVVIEHEPDPVPPAYAHLFNEQDMCEDRNVCRIALDVDFLKDLCDVMFAESTAEKRIVQLQFQVDDDGACRRPFRVDPVVGAGPRTVKGIIAPCTPTGRRKDDDER